MYFEVSLYITSVVRIVSIGNSMTLGFRRCSFS